MIPLKDDQLYYLIERLACFARPTTVAKELKEEWGVEVSLARLNYYDPTKAQGKRELAQQWKDLFFATRKAFLENPDAVPGNHPQCRALHLYEIFENAKGATTQMKALEQLAKERGNAYTNRHIVEQAAQTAPGATLDLTRLTLDDLTLLQTLVAKATLNAGDPPDADAGNPPALVSGNTSAAMPPQSG